MFINIFVALTNLVGCTYIKKHTPMSKTIFILFPMIASVVYHLAETKHGLEGIYPLNQYADQLLIVDRIGAFFAGLFVLVVLVVLTVLKKKRHYQFFFESILMLGFIAIVCLGMSEIDVGFKILGIYDGFVINKWQFLFFHSLWHLLAFTILGKCVMVI
jgi:hypothetical protein